MTDHITTLAVMQSQYSHIRQSDAEWEAIEAAKDALDQIAALQSENAEKDKRIAGMETDIKLAASGRCCQICSRDCLGHEEITACAAFEYRGAQGEA